MKILLIGGSGFIGSYLIRSLQLLGHSLVLFHRHHNQDSSLNKIEHIYGDRHQLLQYSDALLRVAPDMVIDLTLSSDKQAEALLKIFNGRIQRLIVLSSIDDGRDKIFLEEDYAHWRSPRGYVENIVAAISLVINNSNAINKIYNVAEETTFSEWEWANKIASLVDWKGAFVLLPREKMPPHLLAPGNMAQHWIVNSNLIRAELGYCETVAVEKALRKTISWQRAHPPSVFDPQMFNYVAEDLALR